MQAPIGADTSYYGHNPHKRRLSPMHKTREDLIKYLDGVLRDRGHNRRTASLSAGLNHAYLQQFMGERATPLELPEKARRKLASVLSIPETNLRVGLAPSQVGNNGSDAERNLSHAAQASGTLLGKGHDAMLGDRLDLIEDIARLPADLVPTVRALIDRVKGLQDSEQPRPPQKGTKG